MGNKAIATPGQGFFVFGMDPRTSVMQDATRDLATGADQQVVAGFPLTLATTGANQGKVVANPTATGDIFFGVAGTNRNALYGATTLGEWEPGKAVAYVAGTITIRQSVFLDSTNTEQSINPFVGGSGAGGFPSSADVGKKVSVDNVALGGTEAILLGSISLAKWRIGSTSGGHPIANVAVILEVREDSEVDLLVPMQVTSAS